MAQGRQEQADRALEIRRGYAQEARRLATRLSRRGAEGAADALITAKARETAVKAAAAAHARGASAAAIRSAYSNVNAKTRWRLMAEAAKDEPIEGAVELRSKSDVDALFGEGPR